MINGAGPARVAALVVTAASALGGCVSTLENKPASATAKGFRYSLPQPVLMVTPQGDGTMGLEVLYLPDPNNTYAVSATSFLGGYTFEIRTKEGLLESITFNAGASTVAEQAISSYGDIQKARTEAEAKAQEAATSKTDEQAKAAAAEAQALADARTTLTTAIAKRDKLEEIRQKGTDVAAALTAAELAIVDAEQKLLALESAIAANAAANSKNLAFNEAGGGTGGTFKTAAGPMFYRLVPANGQNGRVDLIAVDEQIMAETSKPVKPAAKKPDLAYSVVGQPIVRPIRNVLVLKIRVNQNIAAIHEPGVRLQPSATGRPMITKAEESGSTYLYVVLDQAQQAGSYRLSIPVILEPGGQPVNPEAVQFVIAR
jgi:hypothetical protein